MLALSQLTAPLSEEEALEFVLELYTSLGFNATSWQSGSEQRTMLEVQAKILADLSVTIARYNAGYHPGLAEDAFLDTLGTYVFSLPRNPAVTTQGKMRLTSSAAAPPHSWLAGELLIASDSTDTAQIYTVLGSGSLNPGNTLDVDVEARVGGVAGNLGSNLSTLVLRTPLVGVSVTNPVISGTTSWITRYGADRESAKRYAERMRLSWARTIAPGTDNGYRALAFEALPSLTRCKVTEGGLAGEVLIIGATASGGLTGGEISTIEDYFDGTFDGKRRILINDLLTVQSASVLTTPALALTVSVDSVYANTAAARITAALEDFFGAIDIGGEVVAPDTVGKILQSRVIDVVMSQTGVRKVTGVPADIALSSNQVYDPSISLTIIRN